MMRQQVFLHHIYAFIFIPFDDCRLFAGPNACMCTGEIYRIGFGHANQ